ncbi:MAG TPA: serine/threonine-protein kinase [Ktedonobacteraceae bacterium]|nr:serine/threonine-protein kinase [Ktedonobacteraceae bacterium]
MQENNTYVGGCRLLRLIGQGISSKVYLGEHPERDHPVAVKLLHAWTGEREVQRFLTQAAMLSKLDHPHVIHIYDFGLTDDDIPYLVVSYAPNGTLRQRYPRGTRLPLGEVLYYVRQAAEGLQYVHEHQLVHRDVKPQNMLLDANNSILLNDFGTTTVSYSLVPNAVDFEGTVLYAAPEQLGGRSLRSSDQYALAVMTYELLCGTWPFLGTFEEVAHKHMLEQPPTLREKGVEVPQPVEEALQRALSKEPGERFASIEEFADTLSEAAAQGEKSGQPQSELPKAPLRKQFRSPRPF